MQQASLRGGSCGARRDWRSGDWYTPHSRWLLRELLTELPKCGSACSRLLSQRRQLLTLLQQAAKLCSAPACSCLLTGAGAAAAARKSLKFWRQQARHAPKMQLSSINGSEHCSRWSLTLLKPLCPGELLLMTGSAMQMRQCGPGNLSSTGMHIDVCMSMCVL